MLLPISEVQPQLLEAFDIDTGNVSTEGLQIVSVHQFVWSALQPYGSVQIQAKLSGIHNRILLPCSLLHHLGFNTKIVIFTCLETATTSSTYLYCDKVPFNCLPLLSQETGTTHHWPRSATLTSIMWFGWDCRTSFSLVLDSVLAVLKHPLELCESLFL